MNGKNKKRVALFNKYVAPLDSQRFEIGSYGNLPSIISVDCTKLGEFIGLDGGKVCRACQALRVLKGSPNPIYPLRTFHSSISRCLERRTKETLTAIDLEDAKCFIANNEAQLKPPAMEMKEEAKAQSEYLKYMSGLNKKLPIKSYKCVGEDAAPGYDTIFAEAAELCHNNPTF